MSLQPGDRIKLSELSIHVPFPASLTDEQRAAIQTVLNLPEPICAVYVPGLRYDFQQYFLHGEGKGEPQGIVSQDEFNTNEVGWEHYCKPRGGNAVCITERCGYCRMERPSNTHDN